MRRGEKDNKEQLEGRLAARARFRAMQVGLRPEFAVRVAYPRDRNAIIDIINAVAAEQRCLQTDRYCPTPNWERILSQGQDVASGLLLLVATDHERIIGFGRLTVDDDIERARTAGNIGLALLPTYRCSGIGRVLLGRLIARASNLGFTRLNAAILADNTASQRLFHGAGFQELQRRTIHLPWMDGPTAEVIVGLRLDVKEA